MAAGLQARARPALETGEEQRKAYRQFDIVLVILMFFLFMGLYHIVAMLTVGDWDFWVDWKDRRWWILLTPVILISMPAAVQYIFWEKFRLPLAPRRFWSPESATRWSGRRDCDETYCTVTT